MMDDMPCITIDVDTAAITTEESAINTLKEALGLNNTSHCTNWSSLGQTEKMGVY